MSDVGFEDQVPSLPQGGGGVQGLGATFSPDLSTGTGNLSIGIDLPNGPNDIGPKLGLVYNTSAGNGPFGQGFSCPLPRLLLRTDQGYPRYDGTDPLLLEGAGPLIALGNGRFRPLVDGGAWRIQASGDGYQLTDRTGVVYQLGLHPSARIADPAAAAKVYAWHLESITDPLGNVATLTWRADGGQLYLDQVAYGIYRVQFTYESRPDAIRFGRAGFGLLTQLRCSAIELHLPGEDQPIVRRWALSYIQDASNRMSLLTSITLSGLDATGAAMSAPPLILGYAAFNTPTLTQLSAGGDWSLPSFNTGPTRRMELVDWNGDGLPDILQITAGGDAYAWLNEGGGTIGGLQAVGTLPGFASATTPIAFADMDGDGFADLVRTDRPLSSYIPRSSDGFGLPVTWEEAPALPPSAPQVRLADLDGDGIVDLLASSTAGLTLYYRDGEDGWQTIPQVVPASAAPEVDLADPHVFLADMTGDGSPDLVRVDGGGVTYWPYLGRGRWDNSVLMTSSPELPFDLDPQRLLLADIDGDGVADLILLGTDAVTYWINCGGSGFSAPQVIDDVPAAEIIDPRVADMTGSGTAGLMWAQPGPFGLDVLYFYLDFIGATKPRLLTRIDNGLGLVTTINYTTSAREAARAVAAGEAWETTLPVVVPVVAETSASDATTGRTRTTRYLYRDGRYDGILREFAGFGQVEQQDLGDASIPTLRTLSWFSIGVDPAAVSAPMDDATRRSLRAIRGRMSKRERYAADGSAAAALPFDRLEFDWQVITDSNGPELVYIPRLLRTVNTLFERTTVAGRIITTTNTAWDTAQNIIEAIETAEIPGQPAQTSTLRTRSAFANDPSGRFLSKLWRTQQFDGDGTLIADQVTVYDGAAEGQVGAQGLVTGRSALALSDSAAAEIYGDTLPDFAAMKYFRRADSPGWWISQGQYQRTDDTAGLQGTVTGPTGASFHVVYDPTKCYAAKLTDPAGNVIQATFDYRVSRVATLTDAAGAVFAVTFDALSRTLARIEPGDGPTQPTLDYTYDTTARPTVQTCQTRTVSGSADTIEERMLFDGEGLALERRITDDIGEVALETTDYNVRSLPFRTYAGWRPPGAAFSPPPPATPAVTMSYDAMGRPLKSTAPDGGVTAWAYQPGGVVETDPTGKVTTRLFDATGRIATVQQVISGRTLSSTYRYDAKGNLQTFVDALGNTVRSWYDSFGRVLRVQRPEQDTINVVDPVGNAVEARTPTGTLVTRIYDGCNRPVSVSMPGNSTPVIQFTYHDTGSPAPPDAGQHTIGGRCVRVDDESGSTVFDYDARGRPALKRNQPTGSAVAYTLLMARRADGNIATLTYPGGPDGPLQIAMQYNKRGLLSTIPGLISSVEYDLNGQRTKTTYPNGVTSTYAHDPIGHPSLINHAGPAGSFYEAQLVWDLAGNLTRRTSPDSSLATTYVYDDLHRLAQTTTDSGEVTSCTYDDVGNITSKSDVGTYIYGQNGAPRTCLTTAGTGTFTYTPLGQMAQTPWGTQSFDAMGRLTSIAGSVTASFRYDYTGARASATLIGGGRTQTRLTPDTLYSIEDGTLVRYLFDGTRPIARDVEGGGRTWLHEDHLGSLVALTDAGGTVIDAIRYDAFGAVVARSAAGSSVPVGFGTGTLDNASGLLYLQARYYHPRYGRFISPDPLVQDVFQPIAWNAYAYCRNNPQSFVDPSGREWWKILVGVLAVVALVVLAVVTFGAASPLSAVGIAAVVAGVVAGGVIGGVSAGLAGGSFGDILLGTLVGAAVGGWAAFGGIMAVAALGINPSAGFASALAVGAIEGAANGAAMGFASSFAGGNTTLDKMLEQTAIGALVGAVVGGALGLATYALTTAAPSSFSQSALKYTQANVPPAPTYSVPPSVAPQLPVGGLTNTGQVATLVGSRGALQLGSPLAVTVGSALLLTSIRYVTTTLATDAASGLWTMGYLPKWIEEGLQATGPINVSGKY